jgi:hypothetical protein
MALLHLHNVLATVKKGSGYTSLCSSLSVLIPYSIHDRIISEYGAVDEMRFDRGNRSTWRKPVPNL